MAPVSREDLAAIQRAAAEGAAAVERPTEINERTRFGWKPVAAAPRADAAAGDDPPALKASSAPDLESVEDLRGAVEAHERAILLHALGKHRWNQRQTAKALGLSYDQLRHCIRKHGLTESG